MLSADECQRASKFVFAEDYLRFVRCRSTLRRLLAKYLAQAPESLEFSYNRYGKPELACQSSRRAAADPGRLRFNVAHSAHLGLIGVTWNASIGVDIEERREIEELDELAQSCFSNREIQQLRRLPRSQRTEAFFRGWTRKEALLKAWGQGLSRSLQDFDVTLERGKPRLMRLAGDPLAPRAWSLYDVSIDPSMAGSVALEGAGFHIRAFRPSGWGR